MRTLMFLGVGVVLLAGCSGAEPEASKVGPSVVTRTVTPTVVQTQAAGQPKTLEAATAAATEFADRWSSGDFAGSWLLMPAQVRDGISEADYVKLNETCSVTGLPMTVTGVRLAGDEAVVRLEVSGFKQSRTMVYEDGAWFLAPSADGVKELGKSVEQIVSERKAKGSCNG